MSGQCSYQFVSRYIIIIIIQPNYMMIFQLYLIENNGIISLMWHTETMFVQSLHRFCQLYKEEEEKKNRLCPANVIYML